MEIIKIDDSDFVKVLDKGYIRLTDSMGNELTTVNAAKASFMKESKEFGEKEQKLLKFLIEAKPKGHLSCMRHCIMQFEIKAPLMVARQWFKYRVGCKHSSDTAELLGIPIPDLLLQWMDSEGGDDNGFSDMIYARNEASRRYLTLEPEFYIPTEWRGAPENKKQGSLGRVSESIEKYYTRKLQSRCMEGIRDFEMALKEGVCAEQARLFLHGYGLYTIWRWTTSLQAILDNFIRERIEHDAQKEISDYAKATFLLANKQFPHTTKLYCDARIGKSYDDIIKSIKES